jgi:small subunit ribosomal protein S20
VANIESAKKRARQAEKRRLHNVALTSRMRTAVKSVLKAIQAGDKAVAAAQFKAAVPEIDKAASKGLIRRNRASQFKSRLNARLRAMT